jgi:hypothetical protein
MSGRAIEAIGRLPGKACHCQANHYNDEPSVRKPQSHERSERAARLISNVQSVANRTAVRCNSWVPGCPSNG